MSNNNVFFVLIEPAIQLEYIVGEQCSQKLQIGPEIEEQETGN
jgi:hypothetical protein